jgi:hypothetical protein
MFGSRGRIAQRWSKVAPEALPLACNKSDAIVLIFVFVVALAANSPLLTSYQFYLDDYTQFDKSSAQWIELRGIWRLAGTLFPGWLVSVKAYGLVVVTIHAIGGYLFYLIASRSLGSVRHALFLTVVVLAFPWGYQALIWASASSFLLASCVFWAILCIMFAFRGDRVWSFLLALGTASFLCLLLNEALFFPLCLAGIIFWSRPHVFGRNLKGAVAVSLAPLVGAALWVAAYESLKPALPVKTITEIHIPSTFSAIFYQYANLEVFDVWIHGPLREHMISTIDASDFVLTLLALCAIPFLVAGIVRNADDDRKGPQRLGSAEVRPGRFFICMLVLLLAAGAIYALAGGYSLDSRKRYIIVPLLLMTTAAAAWLIWGPARARAFWPRCAVLATTAICMFGCLTSLCIMSVWKYELTRLNLLADFIAEKRLSGDLRINWNPEISLIWPRAERSWGPDVGSALQQALLARGINDDISLSLKGAQLISWNRDPAHWAVAMGDHSCFNGLISGSSR